MVISATKTVILIPRMVLQEWRPHMCRSPIGFVLDVLESDDVSPRNGRKNAFVVFFHVNPLEIAVNRSAFEDRPFVLLAMNHCSYFNAK